VNFASLPRLAVAALGLIFSLSCALPGSGGRSRTSKVIDLTPQESPRLSIARGTREGIPSVTIQWDSVTGERYTLNYRDGQNPKTPWRPIPYATNLAGTGKPLTVRDETPGAPQRSYMVETLEPSGRP